MGAMETQMIYYNLALNGHLFNAICTSPTARGMTQSNPASIPSAGGMTGSSKGIETMFSIGCQSFLAMWRWHQAKFELEAEPCSLSASLLP